ncbi:MAG: terpene cyclase/mutase family protein [Planctomycetota bacterium]|nr:terpene cyclase/mutase family protein [Planctomycetota bacterium]MDA1252047.1 terpene cyclase/mutase family protein [Planctomycetota bacterium]
MTRMIPLGFLLVVFQPTLQAAEAESPRIEPVSVAVIRDAVRKAIPILEKAATGSADTRKCFTCHNQALPILALAEARRNGFEIDEVVFKRQLQHTLEHLKTGEKNYKEGKGQGGRTLTAGYALWALEAGEHKPDQTTAAVAHFLVEYQKEQSFWQHAGNRPPSSGSAFATTYVALVGLDEYGTDEQQEAIDARRKAVRQWLLKEKAKDTEDLVFRLRSLESVAADPTAIEAAAKELSVSQRENGGWAQTSTMQSDAYATASALTALLRGGHVSRDSKPAQQASRFLLDTQQEDGSWHVVTRAKGFQTYFESGYPHGKDQFISCAAGSWATLALTLMLPDE